MPHKVESFDVPADLRDKLNAMTDDEMRAFQNSVRAPADPASTPMDRLIWLTCHAALHVEEAYEPMEVGELIDFDDPDWDN